MLYSIDSHVHVWGTGSPLSVAYKVPPPSDMQFTSGPEQLIGEMKANKIAGALLVQPINYMYDHSYITDVLSSNLNQNGIFKGLALLDPLCDDNYLPVLKEKGFAGVRFNPSLFPEVESTYALRVSGEITVEPRDDLSITGNSVKKEMMSDLRGSRLFKQCGDLQLPVAFMCFQGLNHHYYDILNLIERYPETKVIIDHFGFLVQTSPLLGADVLEFVEDSWQQLLSLAAYRQVYVKVSAVFRNVVDKTQMSAYDDTKGRFLQLVSVFGAHRLMWGSDWPYVSQVGNGGYGEAYNLINSWTAADSIISSDSDSSFKSLTEMDKQWILRGTAEEVFGRWGHNE